MGLLILRGFFGCLGIGATFYAIDKIFYQELVSL
jgi:hypothetical protein